MRSALILATFLLATSVAYGAGEVDGVYACRSKPVGNVGGVGYVGETDIYVLVSTHADGAMIATMAAIAPSMPLQGYEIGKLTGQCFRSSNNTGNTCNLAFGTSPILTGGISLRVRAGAFNGATGLTFNCSQKIW